MPTHKDLDQRAERTNAVAAVLIEAERLARDQKTQRLRALRLADAGSRPKPNARFGIEPPDDRS